MAIPTCALRCLNRYKEDINRPRAKTKSRKKGGSHVLRNTFQASVDCLYSIYSIYILYMAPAPII